MSHRGVQGVPRVRANGAIGTRGSPEAGAPQGGARGKTPVQQLEMKMKSSGVRKSSSIGSRKGHQHRKSSSNGSSREAGRGAQGAPLDLVPVKDVEWIIQNTDSNGASSARTVTILCKVQGLAQQYVQVSPSIAEDMEEDDLRVGAGQ